MARYAPYRTTPAGAARYYLRVALTPLRARFRRHRMLPVEVDPGGPDYTGRRVRAVVAVPCLRTGGELVAAGEQGTVTGRQRHRSYTVAFDRADLIVDLPAPEQVELIGPPDGR